MSVCQQKQFNRPKICRGDLRHRIEIQERSQQSLHYGDLETTEVFTSLFKRWAAISTISGTQRFKNVNINGKATHLFYVMYDTSVSGLERGNNFVLYNGKRCSVLEITNIDEDNEFIILQCSERGDTSKLANEA